MEEMGRDRTKKGRKKSENVGEKEERGKGGRNLGRKIEVRVNQTWIKFFFRRNVLSSTVRIYLAMKSLVFHELV